MLSPVLNKRENWRRVTAGLYGNRLRSWNTLAEVRASGWTGLVTVRTLLAGGGPCVYDVPVERLEEVVAGLKLPPEKICFNQGAVDSSVVIQGEYLNDIVNAGSHAFDGAWLFSAVPLKMRDALRTESHTVYGLAAREALKTYMTPSSWNDFEGLLEQYPGHVLEVSVYAGTLGDIPGRNAIVWEIRKY